MMGFDRAIIEVPESQACRLVCGACRSHGLDALNLTRLLPGQDDIGLVEFQKIFEAISAFLGTTLEQLLRSSDPHFVNFCSPQRKNLRYICTPPTIERARSTSPQGSDSKDDAQRPVGEALDGAHLEASQRAYTPHYPGESRKPPPRSKRQVRVADQEQSSRARSGIVVQAMNLAKDVVVPSRESSVSHAFEHPWFCAEIDWPNMLWSSEDAAAAAAVARKSNNDAPARPGRCVLENVCILPIFAVDASGAMLQPPQVLGVLQACNKRNSTGTINATGFLETDVSQIRIIARTIGIAIQNASSISERLDKEAALRDVLDGYRRATSLMHYITDPPRTLTQGEEHCTSRVDSEDESNGGLGAPSWSSDESDANASPWSLEAIVRRMACAAAEVCDASICNVVLVEEGARGHQTRGHFAGVGASGTRSAESRPDHLKSPFTARPLARMPGAPPKAGSAPGVTAAWEELLGLDRQSGADDAAAKEASSAAALRMGLESLYMDTLEHVGGGLNSRPPGPVSIGVQEHMLQTQLHEESQLFEDQAQYLRVFSFYGKTLASSECLESLAPLQGVTGEVVRSKQPILVGYAADHAAFEPFIDSKPGVSTASLLSVPVKDGNGRVRAVVTVANRFSKVQEEEDQPDCVYRRSTTARSRKTRGQVGFESFCLSDQLALGLLAEGFAGALLNHMQRVALSQIHAMVQTISEEPTLHAAVAAAQTFACRLCQADSAQIFLVNHSRGECASAEGMKTRIGRGLVGKCAKRRHVLRSWSSGWECGSRKLEGAGAAAAATEGGSVEEERMEERDYRDWEAELERAGAQVLVVPMVVSRDDTLIGKKVSVRSNLLCLVCNDDDDDDDVCIWSDTDRACFR